MCIKLGILIVLTQKFIKILTSFSFFIVFFPLQFYLNKVERWIQFRIDIRSNKFEIFSTMCQNKMPIMQLLLYISRLAYLILQCNQWNRHWVGEIIYRLKWRELMYKVHDTTRNRLMDIATIHLLKREHNSKSMTKQTDRVIKIKNVLVCMESTWNISLYAHTHIHTHHGIHTEIIDRWTDICIIIKMKCNTIILIAARHVTYAFIYAPSFRLIYFANVARGWIIGNVRSFSKFGRFFRFGWWKKKLK